MLCNQLAINIPNGNHGNQIILGNVNKVVLWKVRRILNSFGYIFYTDSKPPKTSMSSLPLMCVLGMEVLSRPVK